MYMAQWVYVHTSTYSQYTAEPVYRADIVLLVIFLYPIHRGYSLITASKKSQGHLNQFSNE